MQKRKLFLCIPVMASVLIACTNEANEGDTTSAEEVNLPQAPSIDKGDTIETTIDIENSEEWVEDAAEATDAVSGDTYVHLDRGVLTVNQISDLLKHLPMEMTFSDSNSQFLYYNYRDEPEDMLAARAPEQVGDSLTEGHPEEAQENMQRALDLFYAGEETFFQRPVETDNDDEYVVISYQAVYGEDGEYKGVAQYAQDIQPIIDFYLEQEGMMIVEDPDAVSGATE
ncbi:hypothetical protein GCM10008932_18630 [Alkalibacterium iburiense]|uniref:Uncharacterized protein n=1 Tax=Alkalibacterium iburiense TaxID=290589 RepID=A0ABP3HFU6_9LACT